MKSQINVKEDLEACLTDRNLTAFHENDFKNETLELIDDFNRQTKNAATIAQEIYHSANKRQFKSLTD